MCEYNDVLTQPMVDDLLPTTFIYDILARLKQIYLEKMLLHAN